MIMTSTNSLLVSAASNIHDEKIFSDRLNFKYLPAYAKYLLENKLDEFVKAQLQLLREINLPLLKLLQNFTEDELIDQGLISSKELLSNCAENTADAYIKTSVELWLNNQLPFVSKSQIVAEDIAMFSFVRRNIFRQ